MLVGRRLFKRGLILFVVWLLVVAASAVVPPVTVGAQESSPEGSEKSGDGRFEDLSGREKAEPDLEPRESPPWQGSDLEVFEDPESAPGLESKGVAAGEPVFPKAGSWDVSLGGEGERASVAAGTAGPVDVAALTGGVDGERLQVQVLDLAVAEQVGASGFVFEVSETPGSPVLTGSVVGEDGLPAEVAVDFTGFADAYGGGFVDRLRLVALPDCVLEDPIPEDCDRSGEPLSTRVDYEAGELVATVDDLVGLAVDGVDSADESGDDGGSGASGVSSWAGSVPAGSSGSGGVLFGLMSGHSGETGSWSATPIQATGAWQVAPGSGEFAWSYPLGVPEVPAGSGPELGLSYSSGAVDGLTSTTNAQGSGTGLGWSSFEGAFIERRYKPCVNEPPDSVDLCWNGFNGTISLAGVSSTLLPIDENFTDWRLHSDAGWKVERLTGASNGLHDGEHWKVTATDGTQYFFGLGENPDTSASNDSALGAPVISTTSEHPCWGVGSDDMCTMGWRWSLDRIVDPNGNVTSYYYEKEQNNYAALGGAQNGTTYDRGSLLDRIEYGAREGSTDPAAARVRFHRQYRCNDLNISCPAPTPANAALFPDVPNDLICTDSSCTAEAPTFFVSERYSAVWTQVRVDGAWELVDTYDLSHAFLEGDDDDEKLYLSGIRRGGWWTGGGAFHPPVDLAYEAFPNRVDVDMTAGRPPMEHYRLTEVENEYGSLLEVTYGQNRTCSSTHRPDPWHTNDRDCFPQTSIDDGDLRTGVFHKYLTLEVAEDPGQGSPPLATSYEYGLDQDDDGEEDEGDDLYPAWAFNYGAFAQDPGSGEWGWSNWRGYGTVTVTQGTSKTRLRMFRGWDGDPLWVDLGGGQWCACGDRDVEVETLDGSASFDDYRTLGGRTLEEASLGELDSTPDTILRSTQYSYERRITHEADEQGLLQGRDAEWVGPQFVVDRVATAPGVFQSYAQILSHNDNLQPETTWELGDFAVAGDERCTLMTYAENQSQWMFSYPASTTMVEGGCESTDELSVSEIYYDGSTTLGALPSAGNPTLERVKVDDTPTWSETEIVYDALGRPTETTDGEGATTTTSFTPSGHLIAEETTVTNDLGHSEVTEWSRHLGQPLEETDANGNVTTLEYDLLGRLAEVWLPTEQPATSEDPSWSFSYTVDQNKVNPVSVRTRQRTDAPGAPSVVSEDAWEVYDGLLRTRQAYTLSPEAGDVVVSETSYDNRGMVHDQTAPQAVTATPGGMISVAGWDNRTRHSYDELGRVVSEHWWQDTTPVYETTYAYGADTVTVTDAEGGQTRQKGDGLGRTVEVSEHDGTGWVTSSYAYDLADNLLEATDPEGNTIDYTYNMAGWRLTQDDPNRGTATMDYDLAGRQTSIIDAEANEVHTVYDTLGRPTERRDGSVTGPLLASWDYDEPGELGLLHEQTSHTPGGDWVSEATGYDARSRPEGTTLTVPAGIPGLSGSYTVTQAYDRADRVTEINYPAVGGLAAETVETEYDNLGLPRRMEGDEVYVWLADYDARGRPEIFDYGDDYYSGLAWLDQSFFYDDDQRLDAMGTWFIDGPTSTDGMVSTHEIYYDDVGNVIANDRQLNGADWAECYVLDDRYRLTEAFTVDYEDFCDEGTPGEGDAPFEHAYTYSPDGNLLERTDGTSTFTYSYPTSGSDRPHAPTSVNSDAYTWDDNGNLTQRTIGTNTETFTWDVQQHLASVDGPSGETTFAYGTGGERLLRQTDDEATLYFAGHEITADDTGTEVTAVRSYSFGGDLVAVRTPTELSFTVTDPAGSVELAIEANSTASVTGDRAYDPYGEARVENGSSFPTDRGFIGQVEDSTTSLSYLNARYYDTTIGVFISTDPIYQTGSIKSLNPYGYAQGNPTSMSDPSGLSSVYTWGQQQQNQLLRDQLQLLRAENQMLRDAISDIDRVTLQMTKKMAAVQGRKLACLCAIAEYLQKKNGTDPAIAALRRIERNFELALGSVERLQAKVNALQYEVKALKWLVAYQQAQIHQLQITVWNQAITINNLNATIDSLSAELRRAYAAASRGSGSIRGGSAGRSTASSSHPCASGAISCGWDWLDQAACEFNKSVTFNPGSDRPCSDRTTAERMFEPHGRASKKATRTGIATAGGGCVAGEAAILIKDPEGGLQLSACVFGGAVGGIGGLVTGYIDYWVPW